MYGKVFKKEDDNAGGIQKTTVTRPSAASS